MLKVVYSFECDACF